MSLGTSQPKNVDMNEIRTGRVGGWLDLIDCLFLSSRLNITFLHRLSAPLQARNTASKSLRVTILIFNTVRATFNSSASATAPGSVDSTCSHPCSTLYWTHPVHR